MTIYKFKCRHKHGIIFFWREASLRAFSLTFSFFFDFIQIKIFVNFRFYLRISWMRVHFRIVSHSSVIRHFLSFPVFFYSYPVSFFRTVRALLGCFCYPRKFDHLVVFYCSTSASVSFKNSPIDNRWFKFSTFFLARRNYRFSAGGGRRVSVQFLKRYFLSSASSRSDKDRKLGGWFRNAIGWNGRLDGWFDPRKNYWVVFYYSIFLKRRKS